jgi:hypothetical protein
MLYELLNQCLGIDCRELVLAGYGALSAVVYHASHAVARL